MGGKVDVESEVGKGSKFNIQMQLKVVDRIKHDDMHIDMRNFQFTDLFNQKFKEVKII